jgi:DNA-binding beta-propeller fold protein YncE
VAQNRVASVDVLSLPGLGWLKRIPVGEEPYDLCYSRTSGKVYCACEGANSVAAIDVAADSVVAVMPAASAPTSMAWDSIGNKLYVGNYGAPELTVVDCRADTHVAAIAVGRATRRVVYNPVSRKVYLACHDSNTIEAVDCAGDVVLNTFSTSGNPWTVAFDAADNLAYSCTSWGGPVICGYGDTLVGNIGDIFYVKGACWNPVTNLVYMAKNFSDEILAIDGATQSIVGRIGTGAYPAEMASMETSGRAYCCHGYSQRLTNRVSVVESDSLVAAITVRPSPANLFCDMQYGRVYVLSPESGCITVLRDGPTGVSEGARKGIRVENPGRPTVIRSPELALRGLRVRDALGRDVSERSGRLAPGVYFVSGGATEVGAVQRVLVVR